VLARGIGGSHEVGFGTQNQDTSNRYDPLPEVVFKRSAAIYPVALKYFLLGEFPSLLRYKISLYFPV
jgi:hypothetical protein